MRYYSEVTKQFYDTEKACLEAEFKVKEEVNRQKIQRERLEREEREKKEKIAAERKARANEVSAAREEMVKAQDKYRDLLNKFVTDYGSFHMTLKGEDAKRAAPSMMDIFNPLFSSIFDF